MREVYVEVSTDLTIRCLCAGDGPVTLLFIPGWTMHADVFEHQLERFGSDPAYRVVAYDPRSQGKSTVTDEGNNYPQHAEDLAALLDALEVETCVMVGWSAGSADIISYVRAHGHARVKGICLIDIPPSSRGHDLTKEWVEFGTKELGDQDGLLRYFTRDLLMRREEVTAEFCAWMLDDPNPQAVEHFTRMSLVTPTQTAALLNLDYWFVDGGDDITALDGVVPLMFFVRSEREDVARRWSAEHTPSAQVDAHGGHAAFWEHPERFNDALSSFLAGVRRSC